jgi:hypothetical protein
MTNLFEKIFNGRFNKPVVFAVYFITNILFFFKSLNNYFLSDDFLLLYYAKSGSLSDLMISDVHYFRPVRMVIYRGLYLFCGLNPIPYMSFNLSIHIVNCFLVYLLAQKVIKIFGDNLNDYKVYLVSFLSGLLFCLHYIHSEAVVNISSTSEILFTMINLICLLIYFNLKINGYNKNHLFVMSLLFLFALFTKETSISLILVVLIIEKLFFKSAFKIIYKEYYLLLVAILLFLSVKFLMTPGLAGLYTKTSLYSYVFESIKNVFFTFTACLFSLDFITLKDIYKSTLPNFYEFALRLIKEQPKAAFLILHSVILYVFFIIRRDKLINFCFIFILLTLIPFMWLVGYERYLYLPSAGFVILIVYYLYHIMGKRKKWLTVFFLLLIFFYNGYSLVKKNSTWNYASEQSLDIVNQMGEVTKNLPSGSKVYFKNLPDNYKGAWIFREGVKYIPYLIFNKKEIEFIKDEDFGYITESEKKIFVFTFSDNKLIMNIGN